MAQLTLNRDSFGAAKSTFTGIHRVNTAAKTDVVWAISFSICSFSLCCWALRGPNWLTFCFNCKKITGSKITIISHSLAITKGNTIKSACCVCVCMCVCVCVCACEEGGSWCLCARVHACTLAPTQDSYVCVGFLRRICVELAHIASLIGEWHIGQRHPQFVVSEIHQLEPAVLQSCGDTCETETVRIQGTGTQTWDMEGEWGAGDGGREWAGVGRGENEKGRSGGKIVALLRAFSLIE